MFLSPYPRTTVKTVRYVCFCKVDHHLLPCFPAGRRVSKSCSPNLLQLRLRTGQDPLEPKPAVRALLRDRRDSFSPLDRTSHSTTDHSRSRCGRFSRASPTVSATRLRRSRCSGEAKKTFKKQLSSWENVFKVSKVDKEIFLNMQCYYKCCMNCQKF